MRFLLVAFVLLSSSISFAEINESREVYVRGTLISAYYQKLGANQLSFSLNIKSEVDGDFKHIRFTGEDMKLALPFIGALGKTMVVAIDSQRFILQVIEPVK